MRAIAYSNPGPPEVLQIHELAQPVPKDREVLVRIRATTVSAGDCQARRSLAPGAFRPFRAKNPGIVILGQELAGDVEAVGRRVSRFREGDPIVAWTGLRLGTYVEFTCLPEGGVLFPMPATMTFEEAATLPVAGLDAAFLMRKARIQAGERVLINGAGGSMGTYAVQIARHLGAEVTGIDMTAKLDMLRSIGAHHTVDCTQKDFIQSSETYDVIFDVIGSGPMLDILNRLNRGGRYLTAVPQMSQILRWQWAARRNGKKIIFWRPRSVGQYTQDFAFLKDLIEARNVKAIVDRSFLLEQASEAHRYVEDGNKQGHVVITLP